MKILGINWGVDPVFENPYGVPPNRGHDTAAVLIVDGEIVAAGEEERFDRIKHSNKIPIESIRHCLDAGGVASDELDRVAYVGDEAFLDHVFSRARLERPESKVPAKIRAFALEQLARSFGAAFPTDRLVFVPHHLSHAASAAFPSGLERSLVLTLDGQGDQLSGSVMTHAGDALRPIRGFGIDKSLGNLYVKVIETLGYKYFDEYKVMGLAPYGDAGRFRALFQGRYRLLPDGDYTIDLGGLVHDLLGVAGLPRRKGEPFVEVHQDVAASLQEALEAIVLHVAGHFRAATGERNLTYAGGVALNCTANGKLLEHGGFDRVFVQPLAYDAGCALGAALLVERAEAPSTPRRALRHLFLGRGLEPSATIAERIERWSGVVRASRPADPIEAAAERMAAGEVIAWVDGRAEFGPRALGHRSILADPRPASNKDRINRMVKKREAYRPFAPSVLAERAHEIFDIPAAARPEDLAFMIQIVRVRPEHRAGLGAITHVDGTARPQLVDRVECPRYHALIAAFGRRTGVPLVLNTSFNNDAEPIVDHADDALACFATTQIDALVLDGWLVERRPEPSYDRLSVVMPRHVLFIERRADPSGELITELGTNHDLSKRVRLGRRTWEALRAAAEPTPIARLDVDRPELLDLWSRRWVWLRS